MKNWVQLLLAVAVCGYMVSCASSSRGVGKKGRDKAPWVKALQTEVAALGSKNWIIVTEQAYPTPQHTGVRVLVADAGLPETLSEVLEAIESEGHIWPKIYTLREFEFLKKEYAPGIDKVRASRNAALAERKSQQVTKRTADLLLKAGMKNYRVLMVKSHSAYPYSSVFMELDSGYWNGNSEDALRKAMPNN